MSDLPLNAPSKRTQADKVQRAAADPNRPGAKCKAPPGAFVPVVDHARC
jgi:4Fe-4S ferredoxin